MKLADAGYPIDWDTTINDWQPPGEKIAEFAETLSSDPKLSGPVVVAMDDVESSAVKWLWPGRFPLGRLSLIVGRPGCGKSFLTIDMAARITTGFGWPDGSDCPRGSVLLISCEDDPADTIRPRLDAAGADCSRVHLLKGVNYVDAQTGKSIEAIFTLADIPSLESALQAIPDCKLVVIDPIGSYLGGSTDAHRDNEVRGILAPVAKLAEKYGVAIVIVAHTRKSAATHADDMALGSRAFSGIVRTSWHLMTDEKDKELRLFLPGKNNLAQQASGLSYRIKTNENVLVKTGQVVWEAGSIEKHADDFMEPSRRGPRDDAKKEAEAFLITALIDGPRQAKDVEDEWTNGEGGSLKTLKRAKKSLSIVSTRPQVPGPWWWGLQEGQESPKKNT